MKKFMIYISLLGACNTTMPLAYFLGPQKPDHVKVKYDTPENPNTSSCIKPDNTSNIPFVSIVHGIKQLDGYSCGYWSLFHAYAIQKCIENNEPVSQEKIVTYAQEYADIIKKRNNLLAEDEIYDLNNKYTQLMNLSILGDYHGEIVMQDHLKHFLADTEKENERATRVIDSYRDASGEFTIPREERDLIRRDSDKNLTDIRNNMLESQQADLDSINIRLTQSQTTTKAHHFIFNLRELFVTGKDIDGDTTYRCTVHWILISVIKMPNSYPVLIILDSFWPSYISRHLKPCVNFLAKNCLKLSDDQLKSVKLSGVSCLESGNKFICKNALIIDAPKHSGNSEYLALFNALAVEECIKNETNLCYETLCEYGKDFLKLVRAKHSLTADDLVEIIATQNANIAVLQFDKNKSSYESSKNLAELKTNFVHNYNKVKSCYFICKLSNNNWITVCVLKYPGRLAQLIILDSYDKLIISSLTGYLNFLYKAFNS